MPDNRPGDAAFDLLCLLVRPSPDFVRARQLLDEGVDFRDVLDAAQKHSLRPQLIRVHALDRWLAQNG